MAKGTTYRNYRATRAEQADVWPSFQGVSGGGVVVPDMGKSLTCHAHFGLKLATWTKEHNIRAGLMRVPVVLRAGKYLSTENCTAEVTLTTNQLVRGLGCVVFHALCHLVQSSQQKKTNRRRCKPSYFRHGKICTAYTHTHAHSFSTLALQQSVKFTQGTRKFSTHFPSGKSFPRAPRALARICPSVSQLPCSCKISHYAMNINENNVSKRQAARP